MAVIATPGLLTSNSYVTVEEANEFVPLYDENEWSILTDLQKENWIRLSCNSLESLRYIGKKFYEYQALSFPRIGGIANHEYIYLTGNVLYAVNNYSGNIASGDGTTKTFNITDAEIFPTAGTVTITATCSGSTVTLTDDSGTGTLTGSGGSGTISYTTSAITLSYTSAPDNGTQITLSADGYYRNKIQHSDLEFDYGYFNDFLKYGAFHVEDGTGARVGVSIASNDVETGVVTLSSNLPTLLDSTTESRILYPIHNDIKKAQLIQILKLRGYTDILDAYSAPEGIEAIRAGSSFVRYGVSSATLTAFERKARSKRLHPLALALIGRFTIYGKIMAIRA